MTTSAMASKNLALSPAAADLGLGDALQQQVEDQVNERKKKLDPSNPLGLGMSNPSPAVLQLFGTGSGTGYGSGYA